MLILKAGFVGVGKRETGRTKELEGRRGQGETGGEA